jgi:hypothetical protein
MLYDRCRVACCMLYDRCRVWASATGEISPRRRGHASRHLQSAQDPLGALIPTIRTLVPGIGSVILIISTLVLGIGSVIPIISTLVPSIGSVIPFSSTLVRGIGSLAPTRVHTRGLASAARGDLRGALLEERNLVGPRLHIAQHLPRGARRDRWCAVLCVGYDRQRSLTRGACLHVWSGGRRRERVWAGACVCLRVSCVCFVCVRAHACVCAEALSLWTRGHLRVPGRS